MKLYRLRLRPLSSWRSPWQADTLTGMLCWACARTEGPEALEQDILGPARRGQPAFVLSDAFPGDCLPVPASVRSMVGSVLPGVPKRIRRAPWIRRDGFLRIQRGGGVRPEDLLGDAVQRRVQLQNLLGRTTDTTRDGGTLFATREWELAAPFDHLTIYARITSGFVPRLTALFHALADSGFGADVSVGKGQFELLDGPDPDHELDDVPAADSTIVLSTFQPGEADPTDGAWRVFTKYGKLGPDFGVADVFKRPLVMMEPGACFRGAPSAPFVGRMVPPDQLLSPETAAELARADVVIAQLAFGLAVPARWPAEVGEPAPGTTEPNFMTKRDGSSPVTTVLLILDVEGAMSIDELREHLPAGAEPRSFRLSELGAPVVARTGPRPDHLDWPAVRRAALALVQKVRLETQDQRVHFFVHGMAPLSVFAYLGLLLSAWAGPITVINRRKDGTVDVCPMQGPRVGAAFFDVVTGLDLEAPSARPGRVAVFISTGYHPETDKLRLFIESGGDEFAGLIEVRTSSPRILDREATAAAADELARHLSLVPSAYPLQKGIALFIAGPTQLALAAGRAVNPTVITDVWIANRGGGGPSGHKLAFTVSSAPSLQREALPGPTERPRISALRITGFRAFEHAELQLDDFTALIGRNGAGKSTLLDAFEFLREAVTDSLQNALDRRGGLAELQPRSALGEAPARQGLGLAAVIGLPETDQVDPADANSESSTRTSRRALYGFRLTGGFEGGLQIDERLVLSRGPSFRRVAGVVESPIRSVTQTAAPPDGLLLPLVAGTVPEWRILLDLISRIRTYRFSVASIRAPAPVGAGSALDRDGGNVANVLVRLGRTRADKGWVLTHLSAITPGIVDVGVGVSGGLRTLYFDQQPDALDGAAPGLRPGALPAPRRFRADEMSDGTLRALGILLACRQQPAPSLVLIDEIEDSMHVGALNVLLDALGATIHDRCQVAITSHSTEVLSHPLVVPERTRLVAWRDGRSGIFELDPGSRASAMPPDTVGSILRINGLYPAQNPTGFSGDIFAMDGADGSS